MPVDRGARSISVKTSTKKRPMDYGKQRGAATKRDGKYCVAEIRANGSRSSDRSGYYPCGADSHATAHVYRRWLCGPAADHIDVVIRTCVECHDMLDGRTENTKGARFPLAARQRAWDTIVSLCRETSTIGPRP